MAFQITGKIEVIGATTPIPSKDGTQTFYRRELVLDCTRYNPDTGEPWENHPRFEFSGNNCSILDQFAVGQRVTVEFSLRGAKYADKTTGEIKYFTNVSGFKVTSAEQPTISQAQEVQQPTPFQQPSPQPEFIPQPVYQQPAYPQQGYAPQPQFQQQYQQPYPGQYPQPQAQQGGGDNLPF